MTAPRWKWVRENVVFAVHDRQIAEHGGADGIRDPGLVVSALGRAINLDAYGTPDAAALAAAIACGFARNHPFVDGNKRTAWVTARLFLALNDQHLSFERTAAVQVMVAVAAGRMSEDELAQWFRERLLPPASDPPSPPAAQL